MPARCWRREITPCGSGGPVRQLVSGTVILDKVRKRIPAVPYMFNGYTCTVKGDALTLAD